MNAVPDKGLPPRRGRAMLTLLFDMGAPIVMFYILTAAGLSSFSSLLLSAVLDRKSVV